MLEINSLVVYGGNGVCKVEGLREENLSGIKRMLYILKPLGIKSSTFYIPVDSEKLLEKVHKLMGAYEIMDLINEMPQEDTIRIEDDRARTAQYKSMLLSGDRRQLVKLTKTLYQRKNELALFIFVIVIIL
ncbi:MAG: CarD family transcriptional regulator [Oscillospiraceae bacterium]|nr:CarD family transcriptional regulator [Oscillospiraceae bacterium]